MAKAQRNSPAKTALLKHGIAESFSVLQIRNLMEERGITLSTLAATLGQREATTRSWLNGSTLPTLAIMEACCRILSVIPVFVSVDEHKTSSGLRDYLCDEELSLYDNLPTNPTEILTNQLRDLQLQRIRIEKDYSIGIYDSDKQYRDDVMDVMEITRRLTDSLAKLSIAGATITDADAVETVYGSPKGPNYDEKSVMRVREADAEALTIEAEAVTSEAKDEG